MFTITSIIITITNSNNNDDNDNNNKNNNNKFTYIMKNSIIVVEWYMIAIDAFTL